MSTFNKDWLECESLTDLKIFLEKYQSKVEQLQVEGTWNAGEVFSHCAQSIDMSLQGFPEMKPAVFRGTIGKLAFFVFSSRKKMSHGLEEAIPGASELNSNKKEGIARLIKSIDSFQKASETELKPHFAYGDLSKEDYSLAHLMHVKNHLERFNLPT